MALLEVLDQHQTQGQDDNVQIRLSLSSNLARSWHPTQFLARQALLRFRARWEDRKAVAIFVPRSTSASSWSPSGTAALTVLSSKAGPSSSVGILEALSEQQLLLLIPVVLVSVLSALLLRRKRLRRRVVKKLSLVRSWSGFLPPDVDESDDDESSSDEDEPWQGLVSMAGPGIRSRGLSSLDGSSTTRSRSLGDSTRIGVKPRRVSLLRLREGSDDNDDCNFVVELDQKRVDSTSNTEDVESEEELEDASGIGFSSSGSFDKGDEQGRGIRSLCSPLMAGTLCDRSMSAAQSDQVDAEDSHTSCWDDEASLDDATAFYPPSTTECDADLNSVSSEITELSQQLHRRGLMSRAPSISQFFWSRQDQEGLVVASRQEPSSQRRSSREIVVGPPKGLVRISSTGTIETDVDGTGLTVSATSFNSDGGLPKSARTSMSSHASFGNMGVSMQSITSFLQKLWLEHADDDSVESREEFFQGPSHLLEGEAPSDHSRVLMTNTESSERLHSSPRDLMTRSHSTPVLCGGALVSSMKSGRAKAKRRVSFQEDLEQVAPRQLLMDAYQQESDRLATSTRSLQSGDMPSVMTGPVETRRISVASSPQRRLLVQGAIQEAGEEGLWSTEPFRECRRLSQKRLSLPQPPMMERRIAMKRQSLPLNVSRGPGGGGEADMQRYLSLEASFHGSSVRGVSAFTPLEPPVVTRDSSLDLAVPRPLLLHEESSLLSRSLEDGSVTSEGYFSSTEEEETEALGQPELLDEEMESPSTPPPQEQFPSDNGTKGRAQKESPTSVKTMFFEDEVDTSTFEEPTLKDVRSRLEEKYEEESSSIGLDMDRTERLLALPMFGGASSRSSLMTVQTNTDVDGMSDISTIGGVEAAEENGKPVIRNLSQLASYDTDSFPSVGRHCVEPAHRRKLKHARLLVRVVLGPHRKDYKTSVACFEAIDLVTEFRQDIQQVVQEMSKGHQVLTDVKEAWSKLWRGDAEVVFPSLSEETVDAYEYSMHMVQKIFGFLQPEATPLITPNTYTKVGTFEDAAEAMSLFLGTIGGMTVSLPLSCVDDDRSKRPRLTPYKHDKHLPLSLQDALRVVRAVLGPTHKRVSCQDCLRAIQVYGLLKIQFKQLSAKLEQQRTYVMDLNKDLLQLHDALKTVSDRDNADQFMSQVVSYTNKKGKRLSATMDTYMVFMVSQAERIRELLFDQCV